MSHLVGLVGTPNVGKSTFFKAVTLKDVAIANYPFTTIDSSRGIGYVTAKCPCRDLHVTCNPKNSKCVDGVRLVPIELMDVAGLVEGAHKGHGMGNQFLDDLRQASALIQVVDASGGVNAKGEASAGSDPCEEIRVLEQEFDLWLFDVFRKNWGKLVRQIVMQRKEPEKFLAEGMSGLGIIEKHLARVSLELGLNLEHAEKWSDEELQKFVKRIREVSKPIIVAANKMDLPGAQENLKMMKERNPGRTIVPVCADAELALKGAAEHGVIDYVPGSPDFKVKEGVSLSDKQKQALEFIRDNVLKKQGSTGTQECMNTVVFKVLRDIVVYPVENESHFSDQHGNVLPDAKLIPDGTTAKELAYLVHTDIGDNFIHAIDCRKRMRVGADHVLKDGDVIKIVSAAKK